MPTDGFKRGGAPIALAPEITLPKPGPDVHLNYSKNDEWAVGMIAHELLSTPLATTINLACKRSLQVRNHILADGCQWLR